MRITLAALMLFLLLFPDRSTAGDADAAERPIRDVISSQIEAFRLDDFTLAFDYASPTIRGMFGSPERFGRMVRDGYPMVHRPDTLRFGDLREERGLLWQRVIVTDAGGRMHLLDYQMIETGQGWRINGVVLVPAPEAGV